MPEMDSRDVVVMKSECREAGQGLGELGRIAHKALVPTEEKKMATDKLQVLIRSGLETDSLNRFSDPGFIFHLLYRCCFVWNWVSTNQLMELNPSVLLQISKS